MTISTSGAAARRGAMLARIRDWLEAPQRRPRSGEATPLDHLNDHLLRDIGVHPHPSRAQRRLLMRL